MKKSAFLVTCFIIVLIGISSCSKKLEDLTASRTYVITGTVISAIDGPNGPPLVGREISVVMTRNNSNVGGSYHRDVIANTFTDSAGVFYLVVPQYNTSGSLELAPWNYAINLGPADTTNYGVMPL